MPILTGTLLELKDGKFRIRLSGESLATLADMTFPNGYRPYSGKIAKVKATTPTKITASTLYGQDIRISVKLVKYTYGETSGSYFYPRWITPRINN